MHNYYLCVTLYVIDFFPPILNIFFFSSYNIF